MEKINVITLGCAKNRVDSEHLSARLAAAGYRVVFDSDRTDAKTVVINTCGFIGDAKQESIDTILDAVEELIRNPEQQIQLIEPQKIFVRSSVKTISPQKENAYEK